MTAIGIAADTHVGLPLQSVFTPTSAYLLDSAAVILRQQLLRNSIWADWKAWTGVRDDIEGGIFLNENRLLVEGLGFYNNDLPMPFILITTTAWQQMISQNYECESQYMVEVLIQARAEDRRKHQSSYRSFARWVSLLWNAYDVDLRTNRDVISPTFVRNEMLGQMIRMPKAVTDLESDIWVAEFELATPELA